MRPLSTISMEFLGLSAALEHIRLRALLLAESPKMNLQFWKDFYGLHRWMIYGAEIALLLAIVWAVRYFVARRLRAWADRHDSHHHSQVVGVAIRALTPMLSIGVIAVALNLLELPPRFLAVADRLLYIATIVVVIFFASKVLQVLINRWMNITGTGHAQRNSVEFFTRIIFGIVATLFVLDNLDVQLKAIWTTLGVGGVAVALALQDTLTNFFAGVYLRLDNSVEPGDYIQIEGSQEGFVGELGWRSARMRTLDNHLVVVPNTKLATTPFINFSVTSAEELTILAFKISSKANPENVKALLVEEATRAAKQIPEISLDPAPTARHVPKLGQAMQDYTLTVHVKSTRDRYNVHFALRARVLDRLAKEGIEVEGSSAPPANGAKPQPSPSAPNETKEKAAAAKPARAAAKPAGETVAPDANSPRIEDTERVIPVPSKTKAAAGSKE
ncbi:MAG TPA: mechanosensitive ion channel family protein [Candidatus Acidoferrales bacterium]|nr:mechanosensitive ion channel family protein [Candidatus Acidoferrales bacterium]